MMITYETEIYVAGNEIIRVNTHTHKDTSLGKPPVLCATWEQSDVAKFFQRRRMWDGARSPVYPDSEIIPKDLSLPHIDRHSESIDEDERKDDVWG